MAVPTERAALAMRWHLIAMVSALTLAVAGCGGGGVEVEKRIGPDGGSIVSADDRALLEVPAGALEQEEVIRSSYTDEFPPVGQITSVYEFGPAEISFEVPAQLTISYDPEQIPEGVEEESLRLAVFSEGWEALPDSTVDTSKHQVAGSITGFSEFAVVPQAPPAAEAVRVEDVEARPATTFRMPIGDGGQSDLGNDLDLLTISSFQTFNYPKIRFNDNANDSADVNEWYVATAFNRNRWLNNGWNQEPSDNDDSYYWRRHYHPGEDWNLTTGGNTDEGKPIHAIADGVVLYSDWAFGWTVIVVHKVPDTDEFVASFYAHLQSRPLFKKGSPVEESDLLGRIGKTGTEFAHLHFEIRRQSMLKIEDGTVELAYKAGHWPGTDSGFVAENYYDPSEVLLRSKTCDVAAGQGAPSPSVQQAFEAAFDRVGGRAALGCATAAVETGGSSFKNTDGLFQTFANGAIEYHVSGELSGQAFALVNPFYEKWTSLGVSKALEMLGYPIDDAINQCELSGRPKPCRSSQGTTLAFQTFEGGALELHLDGPHKGKVYEIHGGIYEKWGSLGFAASDLGLPISDERDTLPSGAPGFSTTGAVSDFEGGHIHWHRDGPLGGQAFETHGRNDEKYVEIGGTASNCGFPVSDVYAEGDGERVDFEGGFIRWSAGTEPEVSCAVPTPTPTPSPTVSEPTPTLTRTEVIVVQLSPLPGQEIQGFCWTASLVVVRPNAWRCMQENRIHDPCFSQSPADTFVICANAAPWEMTGVRMNLTEPLPQGHQTEDPSHAWALELVDGSRCLWAGGATFAVDSGRGNYLCGDGWWIIGFPQVGEVWVVEKIRPDLSDPVNVKVLESVTLPVRTVWR